jgi:hypothetical protein
MVANVERVTFFNADCLAFLRLALAQLPYCLPSIRQGVGILIGGFLKLDHPAHRSLRPTLRY